MTILNFFDPIWDIVILPIFSLENTSFIVFAVAANLIHYTYTKYISKSFIYKFIHLPFNLSPDVVDKIAHYFHTILLSFTAIKLFTITVRMMEYNYMYLYFMFMIVYTMAAFLFTYLDIHPGVLPICTYFVGMFGIVLHNNDFGELLLTPNGVLALDSAYHIVWINTVGDFMYRTNDLGLGLNHGLTVDKYHTEYSSDHIKRLVKHISWICIFYGLTGVFSYYTKLNLRSTTMLKLEIWNLLHIVCGMISIIVIRFWYPVLFNTKSLFFGYKAPTFLTEEYYENSPLLKNIFYFPILTLLFCSMGLVMLYRGDVRISFNILMLDFVYFFAVLLQLITVSYLFMMKLIRLISNRNFSQHLQIFLLGSSVLTTLTVIVHDFYGLIFYS